MHLLSLRRIQCFWYDDRCVARSRMPSPELAPLEGSRATGPHRKFASPWRQVVAVQGRNMVPRRGSPPGGKEQMSFPPNLTRRIASRLWPMSTEWHSALSSTSRRTTIKPPLCWTFEQILGRG